MGPIIKNNQKGVEGENSGQSHWTLLNTYYINMLGFREWEQKGIIPVLGLKFCPYNLTEHTEIKEVLVYIVVQQFLPPFLAVNLTKVSESVWKWVLP